MMKHVLSIMVVLTALAFPLFAHADSSVPNQTAEWAGIKNILSIMGQGTLSPADQKSMLDILDVKNTVDGAKTATPTGFPATPIAPESLKKQPPHRSPSAF